VQGPPTDSGDLLIMRGTKRPRYAASFRRKATTGSWQIPARMAQAYPLANESMSLRKVAIVEGSAIPSTRNCR
jgi:hypothetical protein